MSNMDPITKQLFAKSKQPQSIRVFPSGKLLCEQIH
jgi:hypothetical protein